MVAFDETLGCFFFVTFLRHTEYFDFFSGGSQSNFATSVVDVGSAVRVFDVFVDLDVETSFLRLRKL